MRGGNNLMATRKQTGDRRQALQDELRISCRNGTLPSGVALPPVRELAARHNVSHRIVNDALNHLKREGLLYSVPRLGTFVGTPLQTPEGLYVVLSTSLHQDDQLARLLTGFEEAISRLGGNCLRLTPQVLRRTIAMEAPIHISGALNWNVSRRELEGLLPEACDRVDVVSPNEGRSVEDQPWENRGEGGNASSVDRLYFDNVGGGYQMARYLQQQGHRNIAFLGLHNPVWPHGPFSWSRERCEGWQRALAESGTVSDDLLFVPAELTTLTPDIERQRLLSTSSARSMLGALTSQDVTAVITVNVHAAHGLFALLTEAGVPADAWPVVTTYGIGDEQVAMMTSMLLPWEQMGREAAEILWSRGRGTQTGPGQSIAVPMRLVARLTCRPSWRTRPEGALFNTQLFSNV